MFSLRYTRRSIDEIPPLFITHKGIHDDGGTQWIILIVLHACSDRDTVTDSDLAATHRRTTGAYWEQRHF